MSCKNCKHKKNHSCTKKPSENIVTPKYDKVIENGDYGNVKIDPNLMDHREVKLEINLLFAILLILFVLVSLFLFQ